MTKIRDAVNDLLEAGPGGTCDDCGHFAGRHGKDFCDGFPDKPCASCKGMLWRGVRVPIVDGKPNYVAAVLHPLNGSDLDSPGWTKKEI
jgi:hypothetical protein